LQADAIQLASFHPPKTKDKGSRKVYQAANMSILAGIFCAVIGCQLAAAYVISPPIKVVAPEPGFRYNPSATVKPSVVLEIFIDLNCPDSYAALPVVEAVADHYGNTRLELNVKLLPLPYHRNAFLSSQGVYVIEALLPDQTFNYIHAVLASNANFSTANTVDLSETQVLSNLGDVAALSTGIHKDIFAAEIGKYRANVTQHWKYSIKRLNAGTPTYSVNGVDPVITGAPTFEDWITFLDTIVPPVTPPPTTAPPRHHEEAAVPVLPALG